MYNSKLIARSILISKAYICLTKRFRVALRLVSNRSQMKSKCVMSKNAAHEAIVECVTEILTTF